jgi:pimeloyl-ACP methyl ester carboxylesterase
MAGMTYVLVPGAWHGGWVWKDVAPLLRLRGISVTTPTLTGLGERRNAATSLVNLSTHIEDLTTHVFMEGIDNIVLVGWSYGSFVVAGAASQLGTKVRSIVYVDAIVPSSGLSVMDHASPASRSAVESLARNGQPLPPMPFEAFGVTEENVINFVRPRLTDQPTQTFLEPSPSLDGIESISTAYIHCKRSNIDSVKVSYEAIRGMGRMKAAVIDTGHHCMLTEPRETANALIRLVE